MPNNLKDSQQIGQPRRNGQISRNIPPAETEVALDNWNIPIASNNLNLVYTHPHTHTHLPANKSTGVDSFTG